MPVRYCRHVCEMDRDIWHKRSWARNRGCICRCDDHRSIEILAFPEGRQGGMLPASFPQRNHRDLPRSAQKETGGLGRRSGARLVSS